ncbi:tellurite resistance TerB family protein [Sphingomonas hengshuiensis]|uniref:tellurite resistance TerB family protein n=1 Tax=Sphingomonas hengshuiensis TaxID=1609977 RepID=UPI00138E0F0B|nr:WYL domain-containing protein [Sphingomonas hengshuiensis]
MAPGEPPEFKANVPEDFEEEETPDSREPPAPATSISGFTCIIDYADSKGRDSTRRITCVRLENNAGTEYLRAFCHERRSHRLFRCDRIETYYDIETGEVLNIGSILGGNPVMLRQAAPLHWGLSPRDYADIIAGLNILVFVARCDKHWHPMEQAAIDSFVETFWLHSGFRQDIPIDDIIAHAAKLRPDSEIFYGALLRAAERRTLRNTIRKHIAAVIEADGVVTDEEFYWGNQVESYLSGN